MTHCNDRFSGIVKTPELKIAHVIGSLDDDASGPAYTVPRLCQALAEYGHKVALHAGTASRNGGQTLRDGYCDCRFPLQYPSLPRLSKLGLSRALRHGITASAAKSDVIHTHGLWRFANIYPSIAAKRYNTPLVLSPRGMLAPSALAFSPWSKRLFWALRQREAVNAVTALHATSEQEYEDIRAFGLRQPVAIIPNGIDMPDLDPTVRLEGDTPTVLFLGRLHPVKAIDRLVKAWNLLGEMQSDWRLVIVGPAEQGYDQELIGLVAELGMKNVEVRGPARGAEKWHLLQNADVMVLPSLSENFGVVVAESLACETPVISTKGTPWGGMLENRCGWWIDHGPEALSGALCEAMLLPPRERAEMGARGRAWMERDFSWDGIAVQMIEVYRWLLEGGEPPQTVRLE